MKTFQGLAKRVSTIATFAILFILLCVCSSGRANNNEQQQQQDASLNWRVRWLPSEQHDETDVKESKSIENVKNFQWDDKRDVHKKEDEEETRVEMKYFYPSVPRSQLAGLLRKKVSTVASTRDKEEEEESSRERYSSQFESLKGNEQVKHVTVNPVAGEASRDESIYDLHKEPSTAGEGEGEGGGMFHPSSAKEQSIDRWIKWKEEQEDKEKQQQQQQQQKQSKVVTSFRVTSKKPGSSEGEEEEVKEEKKSKQQQEEEQVTRHDNTSRSRDQRDFKVNQFNSSTLTRQVYTTTWTPNTPSTSRPANSLHRFTNWTEYAIDKLQRLPMEDISSKNKVQTLSTRDMRIPASWRPVKIKEEQKKSVNKLQRVDEEASASQYIASPAASNLIVSDAAAQQSQQTQQSIPFQSAIPVHFPPVLLPPSSIQLQSAQLASIQSPSLLQQQPVVPPSPPPPPPPSPPPPSTSVPVSAPAVPVVPSVSPVALPITFTSQPVIQSPPLAPVPTPLPLFPVSQQPQQSAGINLNLLKSASPQSAPLQVNFIRQHSLAPLPPPPSPPPRNLVAVNEPRVDILRVQSAPTSIALHSPTHFIHRPPTLHTSFDAVASPPRATIVHSPVHHVHPLPPPPPPPPAPVTTVLHHPPAVVHTPPAVIHHPPEIVQRAPTVVHTPPALVPRAPTVIHTPRVLPIAAPLPIVHTAPIHHHHHHPIGVAHTPACVNRVPLLSPSVPVFARAAPTVHLHAAPVVPITRAASVLVPASPVRTRTVLTQVQYLPEQTHVVTTTQYSPARKTTIYETDHLPAYSSNRPVIALPPPPPPPASPPLVASNIIKVPDSTDAVISSPVRERVREHATIYTFPSLVKNRIVGAPIRLTDRIIARRKTRQKERLKQYEERQKVKKDKKIIFIDRKDSHNIFNATISNKVTSAPFNVLTSSTQ